LKAASSNSKPSTTFAEPTTLQGLMQKISEGNFKEPLSLIGSNCKINNENSSAKKKFGARNFDEQKIEMISKFDLSGLETV